MESGGKQQPRYKITATIGLVVHAAGQPAKTIIKTFLFCAYCNFLADGVALGAASGSAHTDVQFIVFLAIMLHKVK